MHPDRLRLPLGRNSRPPFLKSPTSSFFFVSTEITGCPGGLEGFHLGVDMLELSVAIGVVGTFARLAVGLQAEVEALQKPATDWRHKPPPGDSRFSVTA